MAAEESARFVRQTGAPVIPEVLEQLDADVRWLAGEYLRRPKYAVFRPLVRLRRDVFEMIDRRPRPGSLTDLYRVAGQLSALLAHASFDLGQPYAADSHARTAWLCADLSGDDALRPYIRGVQCNAAYWRGEYREAVELARSEQDFASSGSDLLRGASHEARALAAIRDGCGADRALGVAAEARDRVTEGPRFPRASSISRPAKPHILPATQGCRWVARPTPGWLSQRPRRHCTCWVAPQRRNTRWNLPPPPNSISLPRTWPCRIWMGRTPMPRRSCNYPARTALCPSWAG